MKTTFENFVMQTQESVMTKRFELLTATDIVKAKRAVKAELGFEFEVERLSELRYDLQVHIVEHFNMIETIATAFQLEVIDTDDVAAIMAIAMEFGKYGKDFFEEVIEYIDENYDTYVEPISADELAQIAYNWSMKEIA